MKLLLTFSLFFLLIIIASCQSVIKYKSDLGFMNSAQANSPEYLVKVDGSVCKDMDNQVGLCAKRVKSDHVISFKMDKRPYSYRLNVKCSSQVDFSLSKDIPEEENFEFSIEASQYSEVTSFTCFGEVFPQDRPQTISAFWHVRFVVFDKNYQAREQIYSMDDRLILGQNAKYSLLNETILVKHKTNTKLAPVKRAYSESEVMRFNFYGY